MVRSTYFQEHRYIKKIIQSHRRSRSKAGVDTSGLGKRLQDLVQIGRRDLMNVELWSQHSFGNFSLELPRMSPTNICISENTMYGNITIKPHTIYN
jgi:hypothetical protein